MFTIILIIHVLSVAAWFGSALFERVFITRSILSAANTNAEISLVKLNLNTAPYYLVFMILVLITGLTMSFMRDFGHGWLDIKQTIMLLILIFYFGFVFPRIRRYRRELQDTISKNEQLNDDFRKKLRKLWVNFDIINLGIIINLVLALWQPSF